MQVEIPDTPLAAIRTIRHILAGHRIEIGSLNIHPETLYQMLNEKDVFQYVDRWFLKDLDSGGNICGIPFKQKMI